MSTKANVHFLQGEQRVASLYQHHEGDPASMLDRFASFFDSIEQATDDHRYDDPRYLAAKFVVWHALTAAGQSSAEPLATLGICIDSTLRAPVDYDYFVLCGGGHVGDLLADSDRPRIHVQAAGGHRRPLIEPETLGVNAENGSHIVT